MIQHAEKMDGYRITSVTKVDRNFMEGLPHALYAILKPLIIANQQGKKLRVVMDYDPQKPKTEFRYYEPTQQENDHAATQRERNLNWLLLAIPEDCKSIVVCVDGELFDQRVQNGIIPLHDDRSMTPDKSVPCFIGYHPADSQTSLIHRLAFMGPSNHHADNVVIAETP